MKHSWRHNGASFATLDKLTRSPFVFRRWKKVQFMLGGDPALYKKESAFRANLQNIIEIAGRLRAQGHDLKNLHLSFEQTKHIASARVDFVGGPTIVSVQPDEYAKPGANTFSLAHELGHYMNGDLKDNISITPLDPTYDELLQQAQISQEREFKADAAAISLYSSVEDGVAEAEDFFASYLKLKEIRDSYPEDIRRIYESHALLNTHPKATDRLKRLRALVKSPTTS